MKNLLVNASKVKDLINLKVDSWDYPSSTNCYAFALGLDVPFSKITKSAYVIGCFSEDSLKRKRINVYSLDYQQALQYDLKRLGISCVEVDPTYVVNNFDANYTSFLIALYKGDHDFHFLRKNNYDNTWYHKEGYVSFPKNRDDDGQIITNPEDAFLIRYDYINTYKLTFKNRGKKHGL